MKETMWGIDLGGTKVEGIILRGDQNPETLIRTRVDTEAAQGYDHVIGQIEKLVKKMKAESGLTTGLYRFRNAGYSGSHLSYFEKFKYHDPKSSTFKKRPGGTTEVAHYSGQRCQLFCTGRSHLGRCKKSCTACQNGFRNHHGNRSWRRTGYRWKNMGRSPWHCRRMGT